MDERKVRGGEDKIEISFFFLFWKNSFFSLYISKKDIFTQK